jgi:hypothetical protein
MEHWYVYYKVPAADAQAVAKHVRAMFNSIGTDAPRGRLMQRLDQGSGEVTLMEVYEPVADARTFASQLDDAVRASGLAAGLIQSRRIERFEDL